MDSGSRLESVRRFSASARAWSLAVKNESVATEGPEQRHAPERPADKRRFGESLELGPPRRNDWHPVADNSHEPSRGELCLQLRGRLVAQVLRPAAEPAAQDLVCVYHAGAIEGVYPDLTTWPDEAAELAQCRGGIRERLHDTETDDSVESFGPEGKPPHIGRGVTYVDRASSSCLYKARNGVIDSRYTKPFLEQKPGIGAGTAACIEPPLSGLLRTEQASEPPQPRIQTGCTPPRDAGVVVALLCKRLESPSPLVLERPSGSARAGAVRGFGPTVHRHDARLPERGTPPVASARLLDRSNDANADAAHGSIA